jgi:stringent starvation protein B
MAPGRRLAYIRSSMPTLPSKKEVLLGLLEKTSVLMHLDARRDGVVVPRHLKNNAQLILQLGLDLPVPIRDLDVGDDGVRCTLSFSRTPFFCVLPYPAIFAMVSEDGGRAMVWPEDVPVEVARAAEAEARRAALLDPEDGAAPRPAASKRPREETRPRAEQKRAAKDKSAAKDAKEPAATKRELPPYLRVIK